MITKERMKIFDGIPHKIEPRYTVYEFETVALCIAWDDVREGHVSFSVKMPWSMNAVNWFITDFLFFLL